MEKLLSVGKESEASYYGWVVVAMAFLANLIAFGLVYAFSVFLKPLASEFGWSRAATVFAFSAYAITHDLFSPFTGWLTDRFGPRVIASMGGFSLAASMVLMSQVNAVWELYFCFAFLFGWGVACVYGPLMATVSRWFFAKRGLAIGLTAAGIGGGSIVLSPLAAWLISTNGWRTAFIIIGAIAFVGFIPIAIFIRNPRQSRGGEGRRDLSQDFSFIEALNTKVLWIFGFSWLFICIAAWSIMVHIVALLTDKGVSLILAGFLAGLIGVGSLIGRISAGFLSDKLGRKKILFSAYALQMMILIWLLISMELWMFFVFAPIFGISYGGWASVTAAFPADYFGLKSTAAIFGFVLIMAGIGVAVGPYLGGYIFDTTQSYYHMILMCILATFLAIILASFLAPPEKATS